MSRAPTTPSAVRPALPGIDEANPRPANKDRHIVEITEIGGAHRHALPLEPVPDLWRPVLCRNIFRWLHRPGLAHFVPRQSRLRQPRQSVDRPPTASPARSDWMTPCTASRWRGRCAARVRQFLSVPAGAQVQWAGHPRSGWLGLRRRAAPGRGRFVGGPAVALPGLWLGRLRRPSPVGHPGDAALQADQGRRAAVIASGVRPIASRTWPGSRDPEIPGVCRSSSPGPRGPPLAPRWPPASPRHR